jgi:molybdate transport system substrate-binding protein
MIFSRHRLARLAAGAAVLSIMAATLADAAEIKLLCAVALKPALDTLVPEFEKSSGHKVTISYGTVGAITDRIQKGESADVAVVSGAQIDELQKQGKIVAGSRAEIAKVGVGSFVRKGAAKPDISSADAFRRSMLAARSIAYPDPAGGGASGIYLASLLDRLGVSADMKPKTRLFPPSALLYDSVAGGEVEIGFNQISEILAQPSVEYLGPLASAIQNYTLFGAGIGASSKEIDAGKSLVNFLSSPAAKAVIKTKGYETM